MNVKQHYDQHLGNFYSWMTGNFEEAVRNQMEIFRNYQLVPLNSGKALDLGAGHGIQSVALAKLGFQIKAIDFNDQLLAELTHNTEGLSVEVIPGDLQQVLPYQSWEPELIGCFGDTISHLASMQEIDQLIVDINKTLIPAGKLVFSFRNYENELTGTSRFIPVKSDNNRILTCILNYEPELVEVTDLLYEKTDQGWEQKVSSYKKVRISPSIIAHSVEAQGMKIILNETVRRLHYLVAIKTDG